MRGDQNIISCDGRWRDCRNCVAFEMQIPVCWRFRAVGLLKSGQERDMDICLLRHFRKRRRFLLSFGWKIIYVCLRTGLRFWMENSCVQITLIISNSPLLHRWIKKWGRRLNWIKIQLISKHVHYFLVISFVLHRKRLFLTWIYLPIENISEYSLTSLLDHVNNML